MFSPKGLVMNASTRAVPKDEVVSWKVPPDTSKSGFRVMKLIVAPAPLTVRMPDEPERTASRRSMNTSCFRIVSESALM